MHSYGWKGEWLLAFDQRAVRTARFCLLAVVIGMLVSTSLAVGFEFITYIVFALSLSLRRRLRSNLGHPLMIGLIVFYVPIVVGAFYGLASWYDSLTAVLAWRRALLLPLALAVFDDEPAKRLVVKTFLVVCVIGTVASFITDAAHLDITAKLSGGSVFRNYATQGIVLSMGAAIAAVPLLRPDIFSGDWLLGRRAPMILFITGFLVDIIFILPGRSGFGSVLVMGVAMIFLLATGSWRTKTITAGAVVAVVGLLLVVSSTSRSLIEDTVHEVATVDQSAVGTRMGGRIVMWRNTAKMIADHPIFGVGTGGFENGYRRYVANQTGWEATVTGDPHNQFLKFWGEQGLIGLAAVLFFIVRSLTCPGITPYRQLAAAVLLGWCATSMGNSHFSTFAEGRMLFFWLGAMLAGLPGPQKEATPHRMP